MAKRDSSGYLRINSIIEYPGERNRILVNRINHLTASARAKSRMKSIPYVCQTLERDRAIRSDYARFGCRMIRLNFNNEQLLHNIIIIFISREGTERDEIFFK